MLAAMSSSFCWCESVVVSELGDMDGICGDFVNDSVFIIDTARPVSWEGMLQRLRFSDSFERIASDFFDNSVDPSEYFSVSGNCYI